MRPVQFCGLLDRDHAEVIDFHATRDVADRELGEMVHDEPEWDGRFEIVLVDFSGAEATAASAG